MLSILTSSTVPTWSLVVVAVLIGVILDFRHTRMVRQLRAKFESREDSLRKFARAERNILALHDGLDDLWSRVENDRYELRHGFQQINAAYGYKFESIQRTLTKIEGQISTAAFDGTVRNSTPYPSAMPEPLALPPAAPATPSLHAPINLPVPVRLTAAPTLRGSRRASKRTSG